MDKSPFNSPSPQDSPRLSSFTQHHRPVIAVHSGIARSPHPSSALHFPTTSILPQTASTYFPHTAIRYPPHLNPQDPLKDLVSLACDPASQQPGPLNGSGQLKMSSHCLSAQMLAPQPPGLPRLALPPATKPTHEGGSTSPTSPSYSTPGTSPANRSFVGLGPRDPAGIYQAQVGAKRPAGGGEGGPGQKGQPGCAGRGRPAGSHATLPSPCPWHGGPASHALPGLPVWPEPQMLPAAPCQETLLGYCHPRPIAVDEETEATEVRGFAQDHTARQPEPAVPPHPSSPLPCHRPEGPGGQRQGVARAPESQGQVGN
ncbi:nuclear factor I C [Phyllostomus discolor]|uniref:Nuclear factor I C n=1 Tax=Phyllostomus discolor TaxID=89673 RepID=A0A834DX16_9CHIR|nr:nuclear factor I C [Phyllostomus discolor]